MTFSVVERIRANCFCWLFNGSIRSVLRMALVTPGRGLGDLASLPCEDILPRVGRACQEDHAIDVLISRQVRRMECALAMTDNEGWSIKTAARQPAKRCDGIVIVVDHACSEKLSPALSDSSLVIPERGDPHIPEGGSMASLTWSFSLGLLELRSS